MDQAVGKVSQPVAKCPSLSDVFIISYRVLSVNISNTVFTFTKWKGHLAL